MSRLQCSRPLGAGRWFETVSGAAWWPPRSIPLLLSGGAARSLAVPPLDEVATVVWVAAAAAAAVQFLSWPVVSCPRHFGHCWRQSSPLFLLPLNL